MVGAISAAFARELDRIGWMDAATRELSRKKLAAMAYLIGYPQAGGPTTSRSNANPTPTTCSRRAPSIFSFRLNKIGKPVNRDEWEMTPPTVNAYYHPLKNQMVFPAGILQPPFYSVKAGVPVNLGGMGMVVGHELTHGFDDEGSQFDKDGNLQRLVGDADSRSLQESNRLRRATVRRVTKRSPGLKLNGKLTLGENIADMGGVKLAFYAYRAHARGRQRAAVCRRLQRGSAVLSRDGQVWCSKYREEYARMTAQVDPHSPPRFRVNGSLANLPEFAAAFSCAPGTPMNPPNRCAVW